MKILLNALPLTELMTGIQRYVRCLYTALQSFPDVSVSYFQKRVCSSEMPCQADPRIWSERIDKIRKFPDVLDGIPTVCTIPFRRLRGNVTGTGRLQRRSLCETTGMPVTGEHTPSLNSRSTRDTVNNPKGRRRTIKRIDLTYRLYVKNV